MSVVGLGFCCMDYIGVVPHIPAVDEKVQISDLIKQGGGVAGTAIVTVARLGAKTSIVWCVGDDENGRLMVSDFEKEGVDTSHTVVVPGVNTSFAWVLVDKASKPFGGRLRYWISVVNVSEGGQSEGTTGTSKFVAGDPFRRHPIPMYFPPAKILRFGRILLDASC